MSDRKSSDAFHPAQTGFRPCLGTQERLALFPADVIRNKSPNRGNVKKGFDTAPHASIISEARRLNILGRPLNFTMNILEKIKFSIGCGSHNSEPRVYRVGVPQGYVLSRILFNLKMAALPHEHAKIHNLGFTV